MPFEEVKSSAQERLQKAFGGGQQKGSVGVHINRLRERLAQESDPAKKAALQREIETMKAATGG